MYGGAAPVELRRAAAPRAPHPPSHVPETAMPTLHLPTAHTDTDVALAIEVAELVGSHELYVSWSHGEGPGLPPQVETVYEDEREPVEISPFAEVIVAMVQGISALWQALLRPPSTRSELPPAPGGGPRRTTPEEPQTEAASAEAAAAAGAGSSGGLAPSRAHGSSNSTRQRPSSVCISASRARN